MAGKSNMHVHCLAVFFALAAAAPLAYSHDIIIDTQGVDMRQYHEDLTDCRAYADQVAVGERTVKSGVGGAVIGGAIGAIVGNSNTAQKGAGVGAVTGVVKGAKSGHREKRTIVRNCLRGRGYRVLN